jgi:hypothetical protein
MVVFIHFILLTVLTYVVDETGIIRAATTWQTVVLSAFCNGSCLP